jgi:predicted SAM-dependent methyltransferase
MEALSRIVEALPQELRTHKAILKLKEWGSVKLLRRAARAATRHNSRIISKYLTTNAVRKLHLGCGYHRLTGWLNCDLDPMPDAIILDVTHPYPFADKTFDFIYCEHLIEHIPYSGGLEMLKESYRVLKPGGTLRIATPDIRFLFRLYREDRSALEEDYIAWSGAQYLGDDAPPTALGIINNFFRDWGHVFIYDPDTLCALMKTAGFKDMFPAKTGESERPALRNLEYSARMPLGFYNLETFIFEATKH